MENNLILLTILAGTAMLSTTVLAAYSIYFMYNTKRQFTGMDTLRGLSKVNCSTGSLQPTKRKKQKLRTNLSANPQIVNQHRTKRGKFFHVYGLFPY
ncbi:MAG: hypothetical protein IJM68_00900 [Synergistaceae bacterium]|nr:hypothetical protein [Synergistaceae bacterium]